MKIRGMMLKEYRERECITQEDLGKKLKLSRKTISSLETGYIGASSASVERICKLIGCKRTELVIR